MSASGMNRVCVRGLSPPEYICVCIHPPHATCKRVCLLVYMNLWGRIYLRKIVLCACECVTLVVCPACLNLCLYICVKVQHVNVSRGRKQLETCSLTLINTKSREHNDSLWMSTNTFSSVSDHQSSSIQQCLLIVDYPSDECQWLRGFNLCQPQ